MEVPLLAMSTFTALGNALGKADYEWILAENEGVAVALQTEVDAGHEPEAIGRFVAKQIGEHRVGTIARCVSAAKYLHSQRQRN